MDQDIRFCRTADNVTIAYATSGHGLPLVKVAIWLSHLEFDWQSPVWRHGLGALSQFRQLIRYDERGCGLSDREVERFSLEAWPGHFRDICLFMSHAFGSILVSNKCSL